MSDQIKVSLWGKQSDFVKSKKRFTGAFAGKRGGKSEGGAVKSIIWQENQYNHDPKSRDPYLGTIIAPTHEMLRDLSWKKFMQYAGPFIKREWKSPLTVEWHDGSEVRGMSADKPQRLEGRKIGWGWIDEVFQCDEQVFTEMQARVSDTLGYVFCTGSLGVQYINPKMHWIYKYFKKNLQPEFACFEWATLENPHFPQDEIERLRRTLDVRTFEAMYEIVWDVIAQNSVYSDWTLENERTNLYREDLPVYVSIDWGWAHPMVCLFIQYDKQKDEVYVVDEIYESNLKVEHLCVKMLEREVHLLDGCCDIAGNQEREQTGRSNIELFQETMKNLGHPLLLNVSRARVLPSISQVRSYVKSAKGQRRLFVDSEKCPKTLSSIKNYRYPTKHGVLLNENPVKEDDDGCDALRYFFINFLDTEDRTVRASQYA